jgi:hypothetical protein
MPGKKPMDTNVPNAGRVYDYVLGGHHNFEADRQAAEYMISLVPSTRKWVRMLRMFLQEAARQLGQEGFDQFLDFASGLPTEESQELVKPWQPDDRGFRPLAEWLGVEDQFTEEDREGVGLEFYGVFLAK